MSVKKIGTVAAAAAAGVGLVLGGAALADAATTSLPGAVRSATGTGTPAAAPDGAQPGGRGPGGSQDTPVTGDEATKVTDAVKAKDSAVTVTGVRKDPDGSYDVLGTKGGQPVFFEVSKDLKTVTQRTGGPGGHGPDGDRPGQGGRPGQPGQDGQGGQTGQAPQSGSSSSTQTSAYQA